MNYLSVDSLSKAFGERVLFENITFGLSRGDKVALVANNGTGKSTMLKIIAGLEPADSGEVVFREGIRIGFLDQDPRFDGADTIDDYIKGANSEVLSIIHSYESALEDQQNNHQAEALNSLEKATARMDAVQGWDYDRRLRLMLSRFGIMDLGQKINNLSGGQRKRLALALTLLDAPDLLILDEPTNHLDIEMIEWLEKYFMQANVTLLMVTHDRYFLDRVCNQILEMNDGKLYRHSGNYEYFLEKRAEREEVFKTETEKARQLLKTELEWMRRMPKARTTKSKSRIDAFYDLKNKAAGKKTGPELTLDVKMSRIGGKVLELKKVYKSYGDLKIMKGFDYTFKNGERIGIIGKNGVGKTTFLNVITGKEQADSGKINTGDTIVYGYYSQSGIQLKEDKRVIEVLKDIAEVIVLADGSKMTASQFLQFFMFPPEMQYTYVSKLSGGEKRRLHLLTVLIKNPNFLILDEPTNDLDLLTLNKLEEFLLGFGGCLIIVSHDRYFMDKLVEHLFIFEGDGIIRDFWGPYSAYKEDLERQQKTTPPAAGKPKADKPGAKEPETKKLSYKEKFEYENLEKEISELEEEKKALETRLSDGAPYEELEKISSRIGEIVELVDEKTFRWLELDERAK